MIGSISVACDLPVDRRAMTPQAGNLADAAPHPHQTTQAASLWLTPAPASMAADEDRVGRWPWVAASIKVTMLFPTTRRDSQELLRSNKQVFLAASQSSE
jgi:hypothetical protein